MDRKFFIGLILFLGLFFGFLSRSYAKISGIGINPNKFELVSSDKTGKFISQKLTVENFSNQTIRIKADLQPWSLNKNGGLIILNKPDEHSLTENIRFNPSEFDLAPEQVQTVRFVVKVPNGPDGEYREMLFFNVITGKSNLISPSNKNVQVNVTYATRFGTTIYLYKGKISRNASLVNINLEKEKNDTYLTATLKNDGNIHTTLNGKIVLSNKLNPQKTTEIPVRYHILPQNTQKMRIQIPDNFVVNKNNIAQIMLSYLDENSKVQKIAAEADFDTIKTEIKDDNTVNNVQKETKGQIVPSNQQIKK